MAIKLPITPKTVPKIRIKIRYPAGRKTKSRGVRPKREIFFVGRMS